VQLAVVMVFITTKVAQMVTAVLAVAQLIQHVVGHLEMVYQVRETTVDKDHQIYQPTLTVAVVAELLL
jgi:hypothetical protein